MVGMASTEHLKKLISNPQTNEEFAPLFNETTQSWAQRSDVYCKFREHEGPMQVGFGAPDRGEHFGPELGMGWEMGEHLCECEKPILLLKAAYGGRDLAVDFRPPLSGEGDYPGVRPSKYGWEYREMVSEFQQGLANISSVVPGYNETVGYKLAGFVWFHGWNDMIDGWKVREYEFNLANLIRDVRADFDAPDMPFLVGGMGQKGLNPTGRGADRYLAMQQAQRAVTLYDEFRNNSLYVSTGEYMNYPGNDTYNGDYHYYGRADVYYHIGRAFGLGMMRLLGAGDTASKNQAVAIEGR
eukprot:Nitzschia sp. Nitz4//scaffold13_size275219//209831//210899//NITZ4_000906-RA/size275219-augustus-gene-0.241-mRNA-1//1//CDS//3329536110//572//frame0